MPVLYTPLAFDDLGTTGSKTNGNEYYHLWNKFWGKPLDFEQDVTVASVGDNEDDKERMDLDEAWFVLSYFM